MKIKLTDITGTEAQFDVSESLNLADKTCSFDSPVLMRLTLRQEDRGVYSLGGDLRGALTALCDRCGVSYCVDIVHEFVYCLRLDDEPHYGSEYECVGKDCETMYLDDPVLDTGVILAEQVMLAMPVSRICSDGCKGLCKTCGSSLNSHQCNCCGGSVDSPFAVLKKLKK